MIALLLYKGVGLLVQAAAMPLEHVVVYTINAVSLRGWRDVMPLGQPDYPLVLVGLTAFNGFVLVATGLVIGMKLVRPNLEKK